jgi:hypothetical protein
MWGNDMKFEIEDTLAQAILNYLAERPYKEVMQLINDMVKLTPIKEENKVTKDEDK